MALANQCPSPSEMALGTLNLSVHSPSSMVIGTGSPFVSSDGFCTWQLHLLCTASLYLQIAVIMTVAHVFRAGLLWTQSSTGEPQQVPEFVSAATPVTCVE